MTVCRMTEVNNNLLNDTRPNDSENNSIQQNDVIYIPRVILQDVILPNATAPWNFLSKFVIFFSVIEIGGYFVGGISAFPHSPFNLMLLKCQEILLSCKTIFFLILKFC